MKFRYVFFVIVLTAVAGCSNMVGDGKVADYPYIASGEEVYFDRKVAVFDENTSLATVLEVSHFSGIPEFNYAIRNGNVKIGENDDLLVIGDGGFGGMRMMKPKGFPTNLILVFPEYEQVRKLTLIRVANGWKVKSMEIASD